MQLLVLAASTVAPAVALGAIVAHVLGMTSQEEMIDLALGAGENPGMLTFAAMFLASPVQWVTGRSQVRVRKYLGIVFYILALNNGLMFAIENGWTQLLSSPLVVAGTAAVALGLPLFLTSSTWAQRKIGMRRWRRLHKATYGVAIAVVSHAFLVGEVDLGVGLIVAGFVLRIPTIRTRLQALGTR